MFGKVKPMPPAPLPLPRPLLLLLRPRGGWGLPPVANDADGVAPHAQSGEGPLPSGASKGLSGAAERTRVLTLLARLRIDTPPPPPAPPPPPPRAAVFGDGAAMGRASSVWVAYGNKRPEEEDDAVCSRDEAGGGAAPATGGRLHVCPPCGGCEWIGDAVDEGAAKRSGEGLGRVCAAGTIACVCN